VKLDLVGVAEIVKLLVGSVSPSTPYEDALELPSFWSSPIAGALSVNSLELQGFR